MEMFFVNTGVVVPSRNTRRNWDACFEYGFLSAGYGPRFRRYMSKLNRDNIIAAYTSKTGYVGIGRVSERAVRIRDFLIDGQSLHRFVLDQPRLVQPGLFDLENDEDYSEYVVKIQWLTQKMEPLWFPKSNQAFFAPRNTVAQLSNVITKKELLKYFNPQF